MKKNTIFLLMALAIVSTNSYSQEVLSTNNGLTLSVDGVLNVGLTTKTYKLDDYTNTKSGLEENTGFMQLGVKKKIGKVEAGGHIRYGASFEANKDRTGGDLYLKYNFNDKFSAEYAKADFKYLDRTSYGAIIGKNLGTGTQLELTFEGMAIDPILSTLEVDYGVAFLGIGTNGIQISKSDFTADGAIWSAHMAYRENYITHDLTPGSFNTYYNSNKLNVATSLVYEDRDISGSSEDFNCTDKGLTAKATYKVSSSSKFGGGVTYGNGVTNSSTDSNDLETTIMAQNLWYKTKIAGFDFLTEVAHSTFEVDSKLSYTLENLLENRLGADKELTGAYAKISKFTKYGIPSLELKIAESKFNEANGDVYDTAQKNKLIEIKPGITIPSHKTPGFLYGVSATLGKYKSENIEGVVGDSEKSSQLKLSTTVTYIF